MNWPEHPDDVWCDITTYGSGHTEHLLVRSGWQEAIDKERSKYLAGQVTAEQFEQALDVAFSELAEVN